MSNLGAQPRRNNFQVDSDQLEDFLEASNGLATKYGISVSDVIEARRVLEYARRSNILVEAGDYHSEQMGGFGELLQELISKCSSNS